METEWELNESRVGAECELNRSQCEPNVSRMGAKWELSRVDDAEGNS